MANVSSSNGLEKRPKLRFPGFDGPIKSAHLSQYLVENKERNKNLIYTKSDVLSVSGEYGIVNQIEFQGRSFAGESVAEYHVVETNDIVYTKSPLKANPYGIIKVNNGAPGIVSTLYAVYHPCEGTVAEYIDYYFGNDLRLNKYLKPLVNIGAKHDMKVNNETVLTGEVYFPGYSEQKKIVGFLTILDERIRQQRNLVEALKKYKRGLHKLVFIKNRKHSWEKSALHDIASFCGGGTPSKDISSYWEGEIGWISSSDIQEEWIDDISVTRRITKTAIDNSATKLCPEGTIAIVSRVGVGKVAIMPESLCTSQDFTNITSITGNTHYMAYQIAFRMKLEAMKTQGTSIKGVTADTIKAMVLDIPPLEEQKKIADMLTAFDAYIKRAVCELDLFLAMKKALLQQLFI